MNASARPAAFPKFEKLIAATVEAMRYLGGSASNREIHDEVVRILHLSDAAVEFPHKSGTKTFLAYRLHWARSYLKKVSALENTQRGVWRLTASGRLMSAAQVADVVKAVRNQDHENRKKPLREQISDIIENEGGSIPKDWTETLLEELGKITSDAFERLCQRLLRESGFTKVEVTGRAGDGGIDGYGILRVKLVSFQVLFQSKRWKGSVGSNTIRDFRGAMIGRADKGLVITTGTFTKDARLEATRDGAPAIDLVDGDDLCQLLKELQIGVKVQLVEEVTLDLQALSTI